MVTPPRKAMGRMPKTPSAHHEAGHDLQDDVADGHVGEQTDRQAERARTIGDQFDRHQDDGGRQGRAMREEHPQIVQPVAGEADDCHADEHHTAKPKVTMMWLV